MPGKSYALYVKSGGAWELVCRVDANTHADALRAAAACLRPEHADKPIRFEQQETSAGRQPVH
jgi:hypothetical protein